MIYIRHASFQLYHCKFPRQYLKELYHDGVPTSVGVTLNHTRPYDFRDVQERGEWFDVFVALIQYLLSGESKVGFLNNKHPQNLIHKVPCPSDKLIGSKRKLTKWLWNRRPLWRTTLRIHLEIRNATLLERDEETLRPCPVFILVSVVVNCSSSVETYCIKKRVRLRPRC